MNTNNDNKAEITVKTKKTRQNSFMDAILKDWRIKIGCIVVALFIYSFYQIDTFGSEIYTLPLNIQSSDTITVKAGSKIPKTVEVTLTGKKKILSNISSDNILAYVDISTKVKSGSYDFFVEVVPDDRVLQLLHPLQMSVRPEKVTLDVEEELMGYVNIVPVLSGQPAHGYEKTSVTVEPSNVEVHGPKSIIEDLESIQTRAVSIDGITKNKSQEVYLYGINNFVKVDNKPVTVNVQVKPILERKTLTGLNIDYDYLDSEYSIVTKSPLIDITVEGNLLNIENLKNSSFSVSANCSAIDGDGSFIVPVFVFAPENVQVVSQTVESITVKVIRKEIELDSDL